MHEYLRRILLAVANDQITQEETLHLMVSHDNKCELWGGRGPLCNCDPWIKFKRGKKHLKLDKDGRVHRDRSVH